MSSIQQIAISGMAASSAGLNNTANNIANSDTVGFKSSSLSFKNLVTGSGDGAGTAIGGRVVDYNQGGRIGTGRALDMMVDGKGFFMVSPSGSQQVSYTRDGSFSLDKNGMLINSQGDLVQGFQKNASGQYQLNPVDINIPQSFSNPMPTTSVNAQMNLKAGGAVFSNSVSVFDSLGKNNTADITFTPTGMNSWDVSYALDGANYGPFAVTFDAMGQVVGAPVHTINVPGFTNGAAAQVINVDLTKLTQYDAPNKVASVTSDGYGVGDLEGIDVGADGVISARYSNGQTLSDYRVGMASFANLDGLKDAGKGYYEATNDSGNAALGFAGESGLGSVVSNALEGSNVDTTQELVAMIQGQASYRANAKSMTASNKITETTLNLDR